MGHMTKQWHDALTISTCIYTRAQLLMCSLHLHTKHGNGVYLDVTIPCGYTHATMFILMSGGMYSGARFRDTLLIWCLQQVLYFLCTNGDGDALDMVDTSHLVLCLFLMTCP